MEQNNQAKPVTILTGFLGAGKTTFLNALIKAHPERKPIIVENEFGEENIDSELVIGAGDKIFSFSDGCVCCSLNTELFDLLRQLWQNKDKFDELIIEATGIADPGFIAMPFVEDPAMERYYKLDRVICLVDAQFVQYQLENTEEARKQIAFSDILLITKTDQVSAEKITAIKQLLREINPWAQVFDGNSQDGYPIEAIYQLNRERLDRSLLEAGEKEYHAESEHEHHHEEGHHHEHGEHCDHEHAHEHHHHHDIESFSFKYDQPFDLAKLQDLLLDYLNVHADHIYRVKGFIEVPNQANRLVVQLVGNMLTITDGQPWQEGEERKSRLVFIGKNLHQEAIEKLLDACLIKVSAAV